MNPLDQYPAARKYLYMFQWIVNGVLTVAGAVFLINGTSIEDLSRWYVITAGVAPVLWAYLGITAQTNTPVPGVPVSDPEPQGIPEEGEEPTPPAT